ncbi:PLP-dependent aminotransferase family protein [Kineosporia sp. NBRC 101731]|uniref:aminotransferase-like domain-containing protein n=1 Tax=Kineosporia sp. NBRC 101731 TaxID=3032199 RepID=UPI0024A5DAE4|nr:PLP-dependent aminotransferase family protein [Kineosporia sp. NBRC 101731]GLY26882.1 GntR family transcriptional regulator [Kineosporia sp. NBRC 101731]
MQTGDGFRNDKGSRLDRWLGSYAARTHGMTASEIRALFAVASRPEVVSLAGGMPNLSALPMDVVSRSLAGLVDRKGSVALQYGSGQGDPDLRRRILDVMAPNQVTAHPDDIVVTTGSQQALDLVTRIFVDPGDVVLAEAPSYVGALGVFRSYQADVIHVPMDEEGLIPEALSETLVALRRAGRRAKLLYTVPNYHNPAGVTMAAHRRPQILEITRRFGVLVMEDDPYGLLGFDGDPLPAMRSFDDDGVIYLGSFSKTFAPGFRVGWAVAPHAVREKLVLASESAILCPSSFSQMAVSTYLAEHDWKHQIGLFRELYRERRDAMLQALHDMLPTSNWTNPQGGFYVWVQVPDGLDTKAMLPRAVTARVAYAPGTGFYTDGQGRDYMRLSYCYPTPERIREGVRRLAGVIDEELEVQATFGPAPRSNRIGSSFESPGPDLS